MEVYLVMERLRCSDQVVRASLSLELAEKAAVSLNKRHPNSDGFYVESMDLLTDCDD